MKTKTFSHNFGRVRALIMSAVISGLVLATAWTDAAAETVRGIVNTNASTGEMLLTIRGRSGALKIVPSSPAINLELIKLKDGDLLVGSGSLLSSVNAFQLDAIESVGLQELLGRWKTTGSEVFEFQDFSRLTLYELRSNFFAGSRVSLSKKRDYSYVLAPERSGNFSIFLSDDQNVHVGTLELASGKVVITVFDQNTGAVAESITLSPLALPVIRIPSIAR
jgi:hypothetical protein